MRRLLAGSLGLSLGLWGAAGHAGDNPSPAAYPPVVLTTRQQQPAESLLSGVRLGRPVALPSEEAAPRPAVLDQQLRPVSFSASQDENLRPLVRAQSPDIPLPLPSGPGLDGQAKPKATPEQIGQPRLMPTPHTAEKPTTVMASPDNCECLGAACPIICDGCTTCGETCGGCRPLFPFWRSGECYGRPDLIWFSAE